MDTTMKKPKLALVAIFALVAIAGCGTDIADPATSTGASSAALVPSDSHSAPSTVRVQVDLPEGLSDFGAVVRYATTILVGTVQETTTDHLHPARPRTEATVQIHRVLKGDVQTGMVHIINDGGLTDDGRTLYLVGSDTLLSVGHTYIFLTALDTRSGLQITIPPVGLIQLDPDEARAAIAGEVTPRPIAEIMNELN